MRSMVTVGTIKSGLSGKEYEIKLDEKGSYSCNCFAWVYNKSDSRSSGCKHIREYLAKKENKEPEVLTISTIKKKLSKNIKMIKAIEDLKNCL